MNNLNVTIGQYVKGDSFLHKLDPRFKIIATIVLMVSIFLIPANSINNIYFLLGFLGLFLTILLISRIGLIAVLKGIQPILFIGVFTFILQIIYNPTGTIIAPIEFKFSWLTIAIGVAIMTFWYFTRKHVPVRIIYTILTLAGVAAVFALVGTNNDFATYEFDVYSVGLLKGTFFLIRIILIVFLSTLLTASTSTTDINLGLEWVLHPLTIIKVPVAEIAMMFSLTLRFIPTLLIETSKIMKAQASRGIDFNEGTFVQKIKQIVTLLIPMFFISITRAEDLANAMEARGYVIGNPRTNIDELKFRNRDFVSFALVALIFAGTIVLRVMG